MPGTNEILRFCQNDITTNLLSQSEYNSDSQRPIGNQPGIARARLVNKVLRQTSTVSAGLAQWLADLQDSNVVDGLTPAQFQAIINAAFSARFQQLLNAAQVLPAGTLFWWPNPTPPSGWLKRNGAPVSRTTYGALFAVLGTVYGAGDGSSTFNLPDDRAIFIRGWDDGRNWDTGRVFGSQQGDQNQTHTHSGIANSAGGHTHTLNAPNNLVGSTSSPYAFGNTQGSINYVAAPTINPAGDHTHTLAINASGGSEARPFNRAYLPIIKF